MERLRQEAASRLARYKQDHPDVTICQVDGIHHADAWTADGGGWALQGHTEAELLDKLGG